MTRYKPKHAKRRYNPFLTSTKSACSFIIEETTWYIQWWADVITKTFHKFYQAGEWVLDKNIKLIDKIDGVGN